MQPRIKRLPGRGERNRSRAPLEEPLAQEVLALSPREYALLKALIQRSGEPLSRQQVLDRVFSDEEDVQPSAIDVLVHRLRKRLDHRGVRIQTYRGLGYVLESDSPG